MEPNRTDEEIFDEILSKKLDEQWQKFLLDCAKILVEKEFLDAISKSKNPIVLLKIDVRKQKTSVRTKIDFDIF